MKRDTTMKRDTSTYRVPLALALAFTGGLAAGCGDGDEPDQPTPAPAETTPGAVGGGVVENYFATEEYVGRTVTVQAEVTDVLTPIAFELAAGAYGDATLLVLTRSEMTEVAVGDQVIVTGTVRDFTTGEYADPGGFTDDGRFAKYKDEEFLETATVEDVNPGR